jgi:hypothetical protein
VGARDVVVAMMLMGDALVVVDVVVVVVIASCVVVEHFLVGFGCGLGLHFGRLRWPLGRRGGMKLAMG